MTGGQALVQSFVREGVEVVFGIPGIHMSGIVIAMRDEPSIRLVTTRHEQGAAHMADGYARASGKPGVALVVPGTGVYNAAAGVATAYARSSPVLVVAGQISRGQIGKDLGAVHEVMDQAETLRPVTKWRRQALRPRDIPNTLFRKRSDRCALDVPGLCTSRFRQKPVSSRKKSNCATRCPYRELCPARNSSDTSPVS